MIRRIFHYLLIAVAIVFIAMKSSIVTGHVHARMSFATADYLDLLQAAVLLVAAVGSVRFLIKDGKTHKATMISKSQERLWWIPDSIRELPITLTDAFLRRPVLTSVTMLIFVPACMALPIGLRSLSLAGGWKAFSSRDWIVVGVAEVPMVGIALFVAYIGLRSRFRAIDTRS
jgi:uncharacterized membrane protein YcjF (UPF0283 family)